MNQSLLTLKEVAVYLHIAPLTVHRLIDRGDLPAIKVGRVWRIRQGDLETYLDRARSRPKGEKEQEP